MCFTWGQNEYGQLGRGRAPSEFPAIVEFFDKNFIKIIDVSCGGKHTLFLSSKKQLIRKFIMIDHGNVYACGLNDYG